MTTHNRKQVTLACLASLFAQQGVDEDFVLQVFLVDAGSTDGTSDSVSRAFPSVRVVQATSQVFWGSGTRMASAVAAATGGFDFFIWLNDDVLLRERAVLELLRTYEDELPRGVCVIVGQMMDRRGHPSYGGLVRRRHALALEPLGPSLVAATCDTLNGNLVLIPETATRRVGSVDKAFPHAMGDVDFGYRAGAAGFTLLQAAGIQGDCDNHAVGHAHSSSSALGRLRDVASVKRLPPRAWWTLCRRHAGVWMLPLFMKPYLEAVRGGRGRNLHRGRASS